MSLLASILFTEEVGLECKGDQRVVSERTRSKLMERISLIATIIRRG